MSYKLKYFFILAFFLLITTKIYSFNKDTLSVNEIKKILNNNYSKINILNSDGSIEFDSPDNSGSGTIISCISKPDSIFAKLKGPFGVTGALILITRNYFTYYNVQDNFVVKGPTCREYLRYIIKVGLDFNELLYVLSGSIYINDSIYTKQSVVEQKDFYTFRCTDTINNRTQSVSVNPVNSTILKYELFDGSDTAAITIEYSDYRNKSGILFPYSVIITRPQYKEFMKIDYDEINFNSGTFEYKLKPPASAKIIIWD